MGVSVHYKREKARLLADARKSLIGDGILDRARATSFALLGVTAALGLAMVGLALNQNWPLVPGAPIPGFGDQQQAIGDAAVAAEAKASNNPGAAPRGSAGGRGSKAPIRPARNGAAEPRTPVGSQLPIAESVVVSDSTPASPVEDPGSGASPGAAPAAQQPVVAPAPPTPPTPAPEVSSPSQPPADSVSAPPAQTPLPAAGTPPAESPEEGDDDDQTEEGEKGWGDGADDSDGWHRGRGHGYGHGHW